MVSRSPLFQPLAQVLGVRFQVIAGRMNWPPHDSPEYSILSLLQSVSPA